jgi:energy-coupling factor transporter ATP-binding protein EcfA2
MGLGLNPFSVSRISKLPFLFESAEQAHQIETAFARAGYRGVIVGPHGCGKSTLARHLAQTFSATFSDAIAVTIRPAAKAHALGVWRRLSVARESLESPSASQKRPRLLLIDGIERMSWIQRICLLRALRKSGDAYIITTHRGVPRGQPLLAEVSYSRELAKRVVDELQRSVGNPLSDKMVEQVAAEEHSTRDLLMRLFDVYECQRTNTNC